MYGRGSFFMDAFKSRYISVFFGILILILLAAYFLNINALQKPLNLKGEKIYYVIKDENDKVLMETGIKIYVNDEFIDEHNNHYIITYVKNRTAYAVVKEADTAYNSPLIPASLLIPELASKNNLVDKRVSIYHTHNDESYILTSGTAVTAGDGDIVKVGSSLQDCLEKAHINVTHSLNNHGPHDINAYHRSRRTAVALVREGPDILIDIHRDSAPKKAYWASINGVEVAKVMIVVGRSNPNMQTNLEFARNVKAAADELHPGLMRGIFIGKGDYNQDLYPTALLFEVGTDELSLSMANKGVHCLGDALISILQKS